MESLLIILPIVIALLVLECWRVFRQTWVKLKKEIKTELNTVSNKNLSVLGKIKDVHYPDGFEWVLGSDLPLIIGDSTVYRYINGGRCGTLKEVNCRNLVLLAKQEEAAGKVFKIFNWNEILSPRGQQ